MIVAALAGARPAAAPGLSATTVKLFFVATGDDGKSGAKIGCGDSLVAVDRQLAPTTAPLTAAYRELLRLRDSRYGQSGLYNALAQSTLDLARAAITDGTADVRLTGTLTLSGECDAPRIDAQLREVARQFPTVTRVDIFINDVPLATALSAR